ncbi:MAG: aminodeoxychorismate/anthranilate synthase component II [Planctomycetota bacterium]
MIALIDNYDSFTFNLYQLIAATAARDVVVRVVRNDACTVEALVASAPTHVVCSPGPGHPADSALSLVAPDAFARTPVLGVCLGHQAMALASGASVRRCERPRHGVAVPIYHDGGWPFGELANPFIGALYHSLVVHELPPASPFDVAAWTEHGDIMALRHRKRPHVGLQFHPESFMSSQGAEIMSAFLKTDARSLR